MVCFKLTCKVLVATLKSFHPFYEEADYDFSFVARRYNRLVTVPQPTRKSYSCFKTGLRILY